GKFLHGLRGSSSKPVPIVEKLEACGDRILLADGVACGAGQACPLTGAGADVLVPPVIEVKIPTEIVGLLDHEVGVVEITPSLGSAGVLGTDVVVMVPGRLFP